MCQRDSIVAPVSPSHADARWKFLRPVAARPRPRWCPAAVAVVALLTSSTTHAQQAQTDKLMHAGASAAIVDAVWLGAALLEQPLPVRVGAAVAAGAAAGLGKEALDLAGFGTPDVADLLFDAFGIGIGVAMALVAEVLIADVTSGHDAPIQQE